MMYPPGNISKDKIQKIFIASTPFNIILAKYFSENGNDNLQKYIDFLIDDYVKQTGVTAEEIIRQIESKYEEYLNSIDDQ